MIKFRSAALVAVALLTPQWAAAQDWSGLYAGFGLSANAGEDTQIYGGDANPPEDLSGSQGSLFVGYNLQSGNVVYGGELAYSDGDIDYDDYGPSEYYVGRTIQLKGRVGYSTGKALFYGTLGLVSSDTFYTGATNNPIKADGLSFGLGLDYMIGENLFVGTELQRRSTSFDQGDMGGIPLQANEHEVTSVSIRLGMTF